VVARGADSGRKRRSQLFGVVSTERCRRARRLSFLSGQLVQVIAFKRRDRRSIRGHLPAPRRSAILRAGAESRSSHRVGMLICRNIFLRYRGRKKGFDRTGVARHGHSPILAGCRGTAADQPRRRATRCHRRKIRGAPASRDLRLFGEWRPGGETIKVSAGRRVAIRSPSVSPSPSRSCGMGQSLARYMRFCRERANGVIPRAGGAHHSGQGGSNACQFDPVL